jgi:8-oxo-dGTP pyrophosphatase MutT (NUDIX family)
MNTTQLWTKEQIIGMLSGHTPRQYSAGEFPGFKKAAVLVPLVASKEGLSVLLTLRTNDVESHKGQISFPGGMQDDTDKSMIETAVRETHEELGINPNTVEILGLLDDHPVPSKFIITPVVGYLKESPEYSPQPAEVAEVFSVPLSFFLDERNGTTEEREFQNKIFTVWHFHFGKYHIWGATAAIIRDFLSVMSSA